MPEKKDEDEDDSDYTPEEVAYYDALMDAEAKDKEQFVKKEGPYADRDEYED